MSMAKHTAIPTKVMLEVWERDKGQCVVCGSQRGTPNSHVVRRSQGGRGILENIVTHCPECHRKFDGYDEATRQITLDYIKSIYPNWTIEGVTYRRYEKNGSKSEY